MAREEALKVRFLYHWFSITPPLRHNTLRLKENPACIPQPPSQAQMPDRKVLAHRSVLHLSSYNLADVSSWTRLN